MDGLSHRRRWSRSNVAVLTVCQLSLSTGSWCPARAGSTGRMPQMNHQARPRSIAASALPKGPPMTSAISPVQGSDSAGNAVEPVTETVLVTTHGTTSIADIVIAKIAGLATREIAGVYRVGGRGAAGTFGSIRQKIPGGGSGLTAGVAVEVGARQSAVDLDIVVEYGVEIGELTKAIRRNVISAIERMTTLEVTEVNIVVHDVHLPQGDTDEPADSRVE